MQHSRYERVSYAVPWRLVALAAVLFAALGGAAGAAPAAPVVKPAAPVQNGATPAPPPAPDQTPTLQLVPATPAALRLIGVVGVPGLAELLQKAGYVARVVTDQELDAGILDPFGVLLVSLERPFTVAAASFLRDFVMRGGAVVACSWGPAVSGQRQAAFPIYRLQDVLQIRVTGWSAEGHAYVRTANSGSLFRGLPEFLDVEHRATPTLETAAGARVEAVWVSEEGSAGSRRDTRYPAAVAAQRAIYFAPNVLAGALSSREMLRLVANSIAALSPTIAADGTRLPIAELDVALSEARRVAAEVKSDEATTLLAAAEARATSAIALAAQPPPPAPGTTAGIGAAPGAPLTDPNAPGAAPSGAQGAPAPAGPSAPANPAPATPPGPADPGVPAGAGAAAPGTELGPGGANPLVPPPTVPLAPTALPALADAIDQAERVTMLEVPSWPAEVRGVLLPRSALPPSRPAIAQLLDNLRAAGINRVIPEVFSGGVTMTPGPNQDPRYAGHDPLASLIAEATPRGIAVYAWVTVLSGGTPGTKGTLLAGHSGWSAQTKGGGSYVTGGVQWLCPSQVNVRDALSDGIRRALNGYALQGVYLSHLDYGGVPEGCYCPTCAALFEGDYGRNPRTDALRGEFEKAWLTWRRDRVSALVRRVLRDVRTVRPGIPVWIGVSTRALDLRTDCIADWRAWMRDGWADGVCPELDSGDAAIAQNVAQRVPLLAPGARVMPVLSTGRIRTPLHLMDVLGALQEGEATGVLFDLPGLADRWNTQLARGAFRAPAPGGK